MGVDPRFNRRHSMVGHLFQGYYKAILVQKEAYLLELARYVLLNPLRAQLAKALEDWRWSSYPCLMGQAAAPKWLDSDWLLSQFGSERTQAIAGYRQFVLAVKAYPVPCRTSAIN